MEIDETLKSNLITNVEHMLDISLTDNDKFNLARAFEITIGHHYANKPLEPAEVSEEQIAINELVKECPALEKYTKLLPQSQKTESAGEIRYSIPYTSTEGEIMIGEIVKICDEFVSFDNKCIAIRQRLLGYFAQSHQVSQEASKDIVSSYCGNPLTSEDTCQVLAKSSNNCLNCKHRVFTSQEARPTDSLNEVKKIIKVLNNLIPLAEDAIKNPSASSHQEFIKEDKQDIKEAILLVNELSNKIK